MLARLFIPVLIFFCLSGNHCFAQKFLVMDVKKVIGFKRIRYNVGDEMKFRPKNSKTKYKGTIISLSDSIISFKNGTEIMLSDIGVVYRDKSNFVTHGLSTFCLVFGVGFVSLDSFNNLINAETPTIKKQALLESVSFMAAGAILKVMMKKRYKTGKRRSLKIIDLSP